MRVFLSWSGDRSKAVAEFLCGWLKMLIQVTEPWISLDIEKGDRWSRELSDQLEESRVGVICLTPENLSAPWILFEAGALAKTKGSYACTLLIGVKPSDVQYPLAQFQHTLAEREEIRKLAHTINAAVTSSGGASVDKQALDSLFDMLWPQLEAKLVSVMEMPAPGAPPARNTEDMLIELLASSRAQDSRMQEVLDRVADLTRGSAPFSTVGVVGDGSGVASRVGIRPAELAKLGIQVGVDSQGRSHIVRKRRVIDPASGGVSDRHIGSTL